MEEILQQLASDISALKWFLGVVILLLFIVTVMLIFAFKMMIRAVRNTESRAEARLFQEQADVLLEEGKDAELRELAEDRIKKYRADAWAHYYLGMALYRLRDLILAKQHFMKVGELSPQLKSVADDNLEEINSILSETKPRIV